MAQVIPPFHLFLGWNATGDIGDITAYTAVGRATVWFEKSPPHKPRSYHQTVNRNRFRAIAQAWRFLSPERRASWLNAARLAHLRITGYALFVWYQMKRNPGPIKTIERLTGEQLL